jgi:hypothetical protein
MSDQEMTPTLRRQMVEKRKAQYVERLRSLGLPPCGLEKCTTLYQSQIALAGGSVALAARIENHDDFEDSTIALTIAFAELDAAGIRSLVMRNDDEPEERSLSFRERNADVGPLTAERAANLRALGFSDEEIFYSGCRNATHLADAKAEWRGRR